MTTADASLKIEVVSAGIVETKDKLEKLRKKSEDTEKKVIKLTESIDKLLPKLDALGRAYGTATEKAQAHMQTLHQGTQQLAAMGSSAHATTKTLQQLQSQATKTGNAFGHSHEKANILNNTLKSMMVAASAYIGLNFAKSIVELGDAWAMMQAKLRIATGSMDNALVIQEDLYGMAQKLRVPMNDLGKLYARMAVPLQELGKSSKDAKTMVEGVSLALQLGGSTAAEASSATLQFSQAINAGRLNGAEFNAVAEAAPLLIRAIRDEMERTEKRALTMGAVKKLGSDGKISVEIMQNAIEKAVPEWNKLFESLPITVDGAMTRVKNAWFKAMGEMSKESGSNAGLVSMLKGVEEMIPAIKQEMVSALKAIGQYVEDNRSALADAWEQVKGIVKDVWNIASAMSAVAGIVTETSGEFSVMGFALYSVRLAIAGIQDGFTLIGAVVLGLGSAIVKSIVEPIGVMALGAIQKLIEGYAKFASIASSAMGAIGLDGFAATWKSISEVSSNVAASLDASMESVQGWAGSLLDASNKALSYLASEDNAVQKVIKGEEKLSAATKERKKYIEDNTKVRKTGAEVDEKAEKVLAKLRKAANSELEKTVQLYNEQYQSLQDIQKYGLEGDKRSKAEKEFARLQLELATATDEVVKAKLRQALAVTQATTVMEDQEKVVKDLLKKEQDRTKDMETRIENELKEAQANEDKVESFGKLTGAIDALELSRIEADLNNARRLADNEYEIEQLERLYLAKKRNAAATDQLGQLEYQKEIQKEWEKTVDKIDDVFRDGFADMLNNGKSAWKSFTKSLATTFKTSVADYIYKAFAKPIVFQLMGSMAGGLGMTGLAGNLLSTASGASSGNSALSGVSAAGSAANIGMTLSGTGFGSGMMAGLGSTADAAMFASAQAAGNVSTVAAAGNAVGSAMSSLVSVAPYLIAAAVLIKGFSSKVVGSGILGSVSGDQFSGSSYQLKKGGFLKGGSKTNTSALDAQTANQFGAAVEAMSANFSKLGNLTGAGADVLKDFNYEFRLALADFDEEGKKKEIERFMSSMSDSMAMAFVDTFRTAVDTGVQAASRYWTNTIDGERTFSGAVVSQERVSTALDPFIDDMIRIFDAFEGTEGKLAEFTTALFTLGMGLANNSGYAKMFGEALDFTKLEAVAKSGETVVDTFNRLNNVFTVTSNVAKILGNDVKDMFGAGLSGTDARQKLIDLAGGVDALNNSSNAFLQSFYSEAEQVGLVAQTVNETMSSLGYGFITTKEQFKALAKESAKTNPELFVKLLAIAPMFAQVADFSEKAAQSAIDKAKEAKDVVKEAYERESGALKDFIKKFEDFGKSLRKFRDDLLVGGLSNLSPEAKYLELKNRFERTYASAMTGDETALGALQGVSEEFLQASQGYFASSAGYTADFEMVRSAIQNAAISAEAQADIGKLQLTAVERSVAGILSVKEELVSVKAALMSYLNAANKAGTPSATSMIPGAVTTPAPTGNSNVDFVESLYNQYLGRASDAGGLQYYVDRLNAGASPTDIMQNFLNSPEFKSTHGFAEGGTTAGWSWVGEKGPELAYFGDKAHIYTASQSKQMTSGGSDETDALLREVITELKAQTKQGAAVAGATVDRLERVVDKLDKNARKIAAAGAD